MRVRVPFGRSTLTGYIVAVTPHADVGGKPARIREVLPGGDEKPSIPAVLLALAQWVSEWYLAPLGQCLRLAFHGAPEKPRSTTHTKQPDAIPSGPAPPVSDQSTYNVQRLTFNDMLAPLHTKVLDALAHHRQERIFLPAATHELVGLYSNAVEATLEQGRTALVLLPWPPYVESVRKSWPLGAPQAGAPRLTVVALRDAPSGTIQSPPLTEAIAACLAAGKKALLFLNRKGYSPVLQCCDCGQAVKCPACAVGWVYHKHDGLLRCGHCGRTGQVPENCPSCLGARLLPSGFGTEAVEEAVRVQFPKARVARLERDRPGGDRANLAILTLLQAGELNILIGTQLVVTRSPRPVVSLVGLVHPDVALNLPDFRAAERAYHTLREVMALADHKDSTARIVMQTYVPQHHVIRALAERDPRLFYDNELAARKALSYPPFGQLIGLRVSGTKEERVETAATKWATLLRAESARARPANLEILGPIPAAPFRVRGRVRWQLAVKGAEGTALRQAVQATLAELEKAGRAGGLRYDIDVDPQSLL